MNEVGLDGKMSNPDVCPGWAIGYKMGTLYNMKSHRREWKGNFYSVDNHNFFQDIEPAKLDWLSLSNHSRLPPGLVQELRQALFKSYCIGNTSSLARAMYGAERFFKSCLQRR